jgi:hypothetical protein
MGRTQKVVLQQITDGYSFNDIVESGIASNREIIKAIIWLQDNDYIRPDGKSWFDVKSS